MTTGYKRGMPIGYGVVPSLYVGDLHPDVTDATLSEHFSSIGPIKSVRVCHDNATGCSRGYAYVNYVSAEDPAIAIERLNHTVLCGKSIRVMWSQRDPSSKNGNVFVKNLSGSIDNVKLKEMFSEFGDISSCKVVVEDGKSKGFGFVHFDSQDSASAAVENLNGVIVDGKQIYVAKFIKKSEREQPNPELIYTNLYLKNLDQDITEELIEQKFSEFGKVFNVAIVKDEEGNSKGFGFVNFENPESAKKAVETMNGLQLGSKKLYVARAQKKAERREILQHEHLFEYKRKQEIRKNMASNLYVKNIADSVDDNVLWEHFSQYGTITSAKVMRGEKGISKGFGFVCFSTHEEAVKAMNALHGYMFHGKPLYVAIAQRKNERQSQLLMQYCKRMVEQVGLAAEVIPTSYSPICCSPSGVMAHIPAQQGLVYQSSGLRLGWQPSGFVPTSGPLFQQIPFPVFPNTSRQQRPNRVPMNSQLLPQSGQSVPNIPHLRQPNNSFNCLMDRNGQQTNTVQNGRQGDEHNLSLAPPASSNPQGMEMLGSMLATAPPEQHKEMLGQHLFPLVQKLKADLATEITGLLLEIHDNSKLLMLLESPESLAVKVEEAVQVLKLSKPMWVARMLLALIIFYQLRSRLIN